jgi:dienelactone hydrolase
MRRSLGLHRAALVVGLLFLAEALTQPREPALSEAYGDEAGAFSVGFRLLEWEDTARTVTAGVDATPHPRPLRAYVWYPAERRSAPMRFGRYAELAAGDVWPAEIAGPLRDKLAYSRRPLARSLGAEGYDALLRKRVLAAENAEALDGPFPLIVLAVGLYYESPATFAALGEHLAGRGFVVASAPLMGTNSPVARVVEQDLETQVRDLEQVIARARELPFVSRSNLGVIGFDMGGMAGLILTMRSADVDAYASIGSGLLFEHPSGLPRIAHAYDPLALRVPWFHADRAQNAAPAPDSKAQESLFAAATRADRYLLLIQDMEHFDFTSDALIAGQGAMPGYWTPATPARAASSRLIERYLGSFFAAVLAQDEDARAFLARPPEQSVPGRPVTLEQRAAAPASITYEEVVVAVVEGRADEAIRELRALATVEPDHFMLQENNLSRLSVSLLFTWGLGRETVPLVEFMLERYPSPGTQRLLAEAHILAEDYPAAIEILSRFVEQYPNAAGARAQLEALRSR